MPTPWIHGFSDADELIGDGAIWLRGYLAAFGWEEDPTNSLETTWYYHPDTGISVKVDLISDTRYEPDPVFPFLFRPVYSAWWVCEARVYSIAR